MTTTNNKISFRVSPRLTEILGENYRSTELAVKELVDNAWDADASEVRIELPEPMTAQPVRIVDNGAGMKPSELQADYFNVARDRRLTKGNITHIYRRKVKGRKGIGKFAGLMVADHMTVQTTASGIRSTLSFRRSALLEHEGDLENFPIEFVIDESNDYPSGTSVTLNDLHQHLQFPVPEKLRLLLVREYGQTEDFRIFVNGEQITFSDIPGPKFEHEATLPSGGTAKIKLTIAEGKRKPPYSGLIIRVNGKTCGPSSLFGLERDEVLPRKLIERAVGEIEIETRDESLVTADWGGLIENNKDAIALQEIVPEAVREDLQVARTKEVSLAKARYQKLLNKRLEKLPEYRRDFARARLARVFEMFFTENEERFDAIIGVVLDTFEKDEYWAVVDKLHDARDSHVGDLAETLIQFGLVDTGVIGRQARARVEVLNNLHDLIMEPSTREDTIHKILESNLWIFEFAGRLISSNETVRTVVETYLSGSYHGDRASKRPDLLAASVFGGKHLLVELKRPAVAITRLHEAQALQYRDDLQPQLQRIDVLIVGKCRAPGIDARDYKAGIDVLSYAELISQARDRHEWLIRDLISTR